MKIKSEISCNRGIKLRSYTCTSPCWLDALSLFSAAIRLLLTHHSNRDCICNRTAGQDAVSVVLSALRVCACACACACVCVRACVCVNVTHIHTYTWDAIPVPIAKLCVPTRQKGKRPNSGSNISHRTYIHDALDNRKQRLKAYMLETVLRVFCYVSQRGTLEVMYPRDI